MLFLCSPNMKVQYRGSYRDLNNNPSLSLQITVSLSVFSLQSADKISGPQHAEKLQCERRDLHPGAHRRQQIRHSPGHGGWRQQEETLQPQRTRGGHRRQPSQPQHFTDQWPRWVAMATLKCSVVRLLYIIQVMCDMNVAKCLLKNWINSKRYYVLKYLI